MTFSDQVANAISANNSLLCIGLDPDITKLPIEVASQDEPFFIFGKAIVDATADLVCAYKPNSAFYEAAGAKGIEQLKQLISYIKERYPTIPIILDSKRADIGNTNDGYVHHSFDYLQADAVTVHPYLGREAMEPFLSRADKGIIVLCRTSNPGAGEFQDLEIDGLPLYQHVARHVSQEWNSNNNCLLVVGATYPDEIKAVRTLVGDAMYFLIPGIGAQGGDVATTLKAAGNRSIINSSRGIIYASSDKDYATAARDAARDLRDEINKHRS